MTKKRRETGCFPLYIGSEPVGDRQLPPALPLQSPPVRSEEPSEGGRGASRRGAGNPSPLAAVSQATCSFISPLSGPNRLTRAERRQVPSNNMLAGPSSCRRRCTMPSAHLFVPGLRSLRCPTTRDAHTRRRCCVRPGPGEPVPGIHVDAYRKTTSSAGTSVAPDAPNHGETTHCALAAASQSSPCFRSVALAECWRLHAAPPSRPLRSPPQVVAPQSSPLRAAPSACRESWRSRLVAYRLPRGLLLFAPSAESNTLATGDGSLGRAAELLPKTSGNPYFSTESATRSCGNRLATMALGPSKT